MPLPVPEGLKEHINTLKKHRQRRIKDSTTIKRQRTNRENTVTDLVGEKMGHAQIVTQMSSKSSKPHKHHLAHHTLLVEVLQDINEGTKTPN